MSGERQGRIVVIGGANHDIVGHSFGVLVERDSNPGYVRRSDGGVGRNVAENLARMGIETSLVTAFGNDQSAADVRQRCEKAGVDVSASIIAPVPGSVYLAILDDGGDMHVALSDMRALDRLEPHVLEERRELLESAALLVVDANLPGDSIAWLASETRAPIVFDPVSTAKANRATSVFSGFSAVKCNAAEAARMVGPDAHGGVDPGSLASRLVGAGAGSAYVTEGPRGVWYADASTHGHLPAPTTAVTNATGAGDAFTAGVAAAMLHGMTPRHAAIFGARLAGITLASEHTVSEHITPQVLAEEVGLWTL